jgi:NAD(P)H dehydrogenase (quinone)
MPAKVQIVFHSLYGHVWRLAQEIAEGARSTGADVRISQVRELLGDDILAKMHATDAKKLFAHVPLITPDELVAADAIIIGSPTRYGSVTASMQAFFDATGSLWGAGKLIGKIGSGFTSTASQHGGQETTLMSMYTFFLHQGMLVCGAPYSIGELLTLEELTGGSPYGAAAIAGPRGERECSKNELTIARKQGEHVARLAVRLVESRHGN